MCVPKEHIEKVHKKTKNTKDSLYEFTDYEEQELFWAFEYAEDKYFAKGDLESCPKLKDKTLKFKSFKEYTETVWKPENCGVKWEEVKKYGKTKI